MKLFSSVKGLCLQLAFALPLAAVLPAQSAQASRLSQAEQQGALCTAAVADPACSYCPPPPTKCVRTQGYWSNKPNVVWPKPYSRGAKFFASSYTWQGILDAPPAGGNGYVILAHRYIAAVLNRASGASAPPSVQAVIDKATAYFKSGALPEHCGGSLCQTQKDWAAILDAYNNGQVAGGPPKCKD